MKIKNIISLIINFILAGLAILGVVFALIGTGQITDLVRYFTLFSNSFMAICCIFGIVNNISYLSSGHHKPSFFYNFCRLAGVTALTLTCIVSVTLLENANDVWYTIVLHLVTPGIAVLHYLFLESDHKVNFAVTLGALLLPIIYGAYALPLCNLGIWEAPYAFLNLKGDAFLTNLITMVVIILATYIVACIYWFISYGLNLLIYKNVDKHLAEIVDDIPEVDGYIEENNETISEDLEEETLETVEETTEEEVQEENVTTEEVIEDKNTAPEYRIYHVSKRASDGKWQVKFTKGQRAIKLFRTQAEAIEFAKKLAESQNGSIRVHSVKGKIRKA
jgi:hypothetical protein